VPISTSLRPYRKLARRGKIRSQKPKPAEVVVDVKAPDYSDLPEEYQELAQRIGENNARICYRLEQRGITADSSAELLAYNFLERNNIPFYHQVPIWGGKIPNGLVVDFLLLHWPAGGMVWRIQGVWWHGRSDTVYSDKAEKQRLIGASAYGITIMRVVDLWDTDIYASRKSLEDGLKGIEWRFHV